MAGKTKTAKTTATKTFESTTEKSTKAVNEGFEKAVASFGEINAFSKENVEAVVASVTTAGKGAEKFNAKVAEYAKQAMEDSVAAAKKLAGAKSVQEVIELQSTLAKSSMDTYIGEVNALADLYAASVKDAMKPLNDRVSAAVELFQAQR